MADEHKHGTMDIQEQEKTFAGFVTFTKVTVVLILLAVVTLGLVNG